MRQFTLIIEFFGASYFTHRIELKSPIPRADDPNWSGVQQTQVPEPNA